MNRESTFELETNPEAWAHALVEIYLTAGLPVEYAWASARADLQCCFRSEEA